MQQQDVTTKVDAAVRMLYARDAFLLEHNVGERSIVAKLASYMTLVFSDYDVDVEYNRQGLDPTDPKILKLPKSCRGGGKKRVYPDIIVHRRGDIHGHNLLAVEIKRASNIEPRDCDEAKLEAMKSVYHYQFGLFVELPSGPGASSKRSILRWL